MGRQNWRTPPSVFDTLQAHFGPFDFDAAADPKNALCPEFATEQGRSPPPMDRSSWTGWTIRGARHIAVKENAMRMTSTTVYLTPDQFAELQAIKHKTSVPISVIVRRAIDREIRRIDLVMERQQKASDRWEKQEAKKRSR